MLKFDVSNCNFPGEGQFPGGGEAPSEGSATDFYLTDKVNAFSGLKALQA